MFALSFLLHAAIFFIVAGGHLLPAFRAEEQPVTYVDLMTLPVASPRAGTPAPSAGSEAAMPAPPAPPAAAAPAPQKPEMALPSKSKAKAPAPKAAEKGAPAKTAKPDDAQEFNERMAKLERQAEERRQAEVFERLKSRGGKGGSAGVTGMPGARGTEAGSDYASYVQSRFKDAFSAVMAAQSKSPLLIATITIGADGKIAEYHVDKSSGDPVFDDAVARAVRLAERTLKPPPGGGQFKRAFRFRPEGVGIK